MESKVWKVSANGKIVSDKHMTEEEAQESARNWRNEGHRVVGIMNMFLAEHNNEEHNFHTNIEGSGSDVCMECDLIRRTGGSYDWLDEEIVTEEEYNQTLRLKTGEVQ